MNTRNITVFDPAMCCSTGVCGPQVDPDLARFSADLEWLAAQGVNVRRFNLAQEPGAFVGDAAAKSALEHQGASALPLVKAGDVVVSSGVYPSRDELSTWAGLGHAGEAPARAASVATGGCCSPDEAAPAAKQPRCC